MPYTPPAHRSPASSASASPDASRRPSFHSGPRPSLPRSASYLNKHRRTPSATFSDGSMGSLTPQGTAEDLPALAAEANKMVNATIRQSPPPRTDDRGMPKGAVISPPESATSGSDDEAGLEMTKRKPSQLKDLREAISLIPQTRTPSPPPKIDTSGNTEQQEGSPPRGIHFSFSTSALGDLCNHSRSPSHIRSATEPSTLSQSTDNSITVSEEDTDEDLRLKPQMVRKKSGELVRPALRPPSRRRPSSMPGTPVFSKAVHFDSHLEHVRHFLQVDRPLAVSAGSSPNDNYDSDAEYPFPASQDRSAAKSPPFEWEILTPNFPHDGVARKALPVKVEKVWLSADQKSMHGSVAVANLAFQKSIVCRFTLDYWKTTSEVAADYSHEIRPRETAVGYDRFNFIIKLSDTANLESKTLFFCVRYSVNGQEFWDNNSSSNFQVDFHKKHLPQNGKNCFQGAGSKPQNGLPRSNRRRSSALRPKSMPTSLLDFGKEARINFDQPIHAYLGESEPPTLRLKTKSKSSSSIATDNIAKDLSSPSGAAFANRYDFGASLSAAVQAAKDTMGKDNDDTDALYMKNNVRAPRSTSNVPSISTSPKFNPIQSAPGTDSPVVGLPSASYEELVNKYCFFGTKQPGPATKDGTLRSGQFDGTYRSEISSHRSRGALAGHGGWNTGFVPGQAMQTSINNAPYWSTGSPGSSPEASPLQEYITISGHSSTPNVKAAPATRSPIPSSTTEFQYHSQHQVLPERFPWIGDNQTPKAIRG